MKLTQSPNSISRLLWHMKFSRRILETIPAPDLAGFPRGSAKTLESPMGVAVLETLRRDRDRKTMQEKEGNDRRSDEGREGKSAKAEAKRKHGFSKASEKMALTI
ncbi:hypothetical protein BHE74_00027588 [Ensete ventricosum]|nr:hypothetical protein GW17_00021002 [Ensete ventricosum]RWW65116.1 hypothetical protein BHE74_00027588 [Ensete ventricosum]RZS00905.1 hypothetical protein BHM03_00030696 [Ensete ventricosum]